MRTVILLLSLATILSGCATQQQTVYQQLGGSDKVAEIVDNFVTEIEYDPIILGYFEGSDIDRFKKKLTEQICVLTGGPCQYSGDTMEQVHQGMNITEGHFNRTVDLLIKAMDKAEVSHPMQNQVLKVLAPTRKDMLYQ
ncbi:group 1 truncated hemoglobin [Aliiglaciecola sp. LCG003]|uniref:group I truncated hemoglobin n=1 Tax=Aliiglaciecola sp. LCG003 TaxID=3053655 RepID=UPI0025728C52|nr:group 1 truncated hemoglobin [Aliiglaciecola sp. LCG003]WJG09077.1 group 1 truncated hemoglobin [Aliiglaciecola sp. LCG003]